MKHFKIVTAFIASAIMITSCSQPKEDSATETKSESSEVITAKADPAQLKQEIQALETAWSNADNARDVNALAAFYSDDAISMSSDKPMLIGNAAIKKDMEESIAKRTKGATTAYEVMDVYGSGNYVTETGTTTRKDSTGTITSKGKYMAIWEKRDGKWICIRDIGNEDAKAK